MGALLIRYTIIKNRLAKLGYIVHGEELNAADFGVPQQRRRAWLFCVLEADDFSGAWETPTCIKNDLALFERPCPSLESCIDLKSTVNSSSKKGGTISKGSKTPKWKSGFAAQCEIYGKAWWWGRKE